MSRRKAAIIAHLALLGLLVAAIPSTFVCTGDVIGSCLFLLAPVLLGLAVFVLIGLVRWAGGPAGTLYVADFATLLLAWSLASSTDMAALVVVGAAVAIVALTVAQRAREGPADQGSQPGRGRP